MKVLIIGTVWPEPASSAAGSRMMQLMEIFQSARWNLTFASAAEKTPHSENIGVDEVFIKLNDSSFDEFISELSPNVVVFDRFMTEEQFGWRVEENCPAAMRILNTEDLHSLRLYRQRCLKQNTEFEMMEYLGEEATLRELSSIYRSDLTLIISSYEYQFLVNEIGITSTILHYIPLLHEKKPNNIPDFEARKDFVTIGNFRHPPNLDSVRYMKETIWPLIRKRLPEACFHVYGSYAGPEVMKMHNSKDGFLVHGRAESAEKVLKSARVSLAYLRFGAGLKGKVFESLQAGTPVVTTPTGAEGIFDNENAPGFVAESPDVFAESAVELYTDEKLWKEKGNQGIELLKANFKKEVFADELIQNIKNSVNELENCRNQNLIGSMLRYHLHRSNKFMSKWIEEKNRR